MMNNSPFFRAKACGDGRKLNRSAKMERKPKSLQRPKHLQHHRQKWLPNISFKIFINSYVDYGVFRLEILKYHDSVREKDSLPSVGQWNMMNKIRMINGGIIFCAIIVLKFFVPKRAKMAKNQTVLKYHESGREKDCLPSVGQWNMMKKIRMINGGIIFVCDHSSQFFRAKACADGKRSIGETEKEIDKAIFHNLV
ncbi:hypothetical protein CASFOL_003997 [Castilleja foliolosa]|uniref:Uncharacterized protein n=1 Tax=Castilleja foliolosa TaxID=1961234 RepID=A0ABD3EJE8_9LAMI